MAKNARLDHQETSRMSIWSRSIVKLVYYSARCGLSSCSTDFTEGHSTTNIRPPTSILYVRCIIIRARDRSTSIGRWLAPLRVFSTFFNNRNREKNSKRIFFYKKEWFSNFFKFNLTLPNCRSIRRSTSCRNCRDELFENIELIWFLI